VGGRHILDDDKPAAGDRDRSETVSSDDGATRASTTVTAKRKRAD